AQVEAEYEALTPDRAGNGFQRAEAGQRLQAHDDPGGARCDEGHGARGTGDARIDERPSADAGDGPHQGALRLTTRDRIEIRDVEFVAAEPLSERTRERDRVSHRSEERRVGKECRARGSRYR